VSVTAAIWWACLAAVVVVLVLIGLQLARIVGQLGRIERRVAAYDELPLVAALRRAEISGARIEAAVAEVEPLIARAASAVEIIKRGPLPREVIVVYRRLRAEIAAFRLALPRRRG
jgi:hypothetical protein